MATAKKLPSGNWRCLAYVGTVDGKRKYKSFTAETKREAEYQANNYLRNNNAEKEGKYKTLEKAMTEYIESKSNILSPATIKAYDSIKNNRLKGIMQENIYTLTVEKIQNEINVEANNLSYKTIKNVYGLFTATLQHFIPNHKFDITFPQKKKIDIYIPTKEEVEQIYEITKDTDLEIPVLLASACGMRRSEICALDETTDIDYKNNTIRINKAVVYDKDNNTVIKQPKTYTSNRTIEVPKFILDKIKKRGLPDISPDVITKRFRAMLKKYNINHFRFHDLRHYHASVMLALNIPDKYAMKRLGHSSDNMLKTVYQHTMKDKEKEITKTLNNYFMQHETQHKKNKSL